MFWLLAGLAIATAVAVGSSSSSRSSSAPSSLTRQVHSGPLLPDPPNHPPPPLRIIVDPPTVTASVTTFVLVALVVGILFGGWLFYSGAFDLSNVQLAITTLLVSAACGAVPALGVWRYQARLYERSCAFAELTYEDELRSHQEQCKQLDIDYMDLVDRLQNEWDARRAKEWARGYAVRQELEAAQARQRAEEDEARRQREELAENIREAAALAEQAVEAVRERTRRVRTALAWWTTEHPHLDERARAFWTDIIGQAASYRARYDDPTGPCATAERCRELAAWALDEIPGEVRHFLTDGPPTVEELASILRRHHGHEIEELLPRARAWQRAERLRPATEPAAAADSSPFSNLLADLPPAMRAELSKSIHAVMHVDDVASITAKILDHHKRRLEAEGVPNNVIDERLEALEQNLNRVAREFARKRGIS